MKPIFHIRIFCALALLAFAALALAACANVDPSIVNPTRVYRDAPVEKSKLAISVKPKSQLSDAPRVLMYPFWIAQKMENHLLIGRELARLVHQTWTEEAVFETLMFDPQLVYRGPEQAVSVARRAGADLVVVGIVPYLYTGGSVDSTAVTLQIRIYETKGGALLLSMDQSARVNAKLVKDWILFDLHTRLSDSPLTEAMVSMARDMAVPLKSWMPATDEELGFADNSQAMTRNILASGSPLAGDDDSDASRGMAAGLLNSAGKNGKRAPGSLKLKIEFDFDSARIREESHPMLNELAKALKSDALKGRKVLLSGHCDYVGTAEYNQKLSERRSASVKAYLVERGGVDAATLRTNGYGKRRPLVPNTTEANRQRNRRVEVRLDN
jgi:OOP family OmpA-OmpF porin